MLKALVVKERPFRSTYEPDGTPLITPNRYSQTLFFLSCHDSSTLCCFHFFPLFLISLSLVQSTPRRLVLPANRRYYKTNKHQDFGLWNKESQCICFSIKTSVWFAYVKWSYKSFTSTFYRLDLKNRCHI